MNRECSSRLSLTSRLDEKGIHIEHMVDITDLHRRQTSPFGQASLVRARTMTRIIISKERFIIGKEASAVDYCINDNAAISRSHACIIYKDSRYYIQDMGSTNGTYVNNLQVRDRQWQELLPGYQVTLANDLFYFQ